MNETALWLFIAAGVMSVFMVVRHTRTEEETERAELVRAGACRSSRCAGVSDDRRPRGQHGHRRRERRRTDRVRTAADRVAGVRCVDGRRRHGVRRCRRGDRAGRQWIPGGAGRWWSGDRRGVRPAGDRRRRQRGPLVDVTDRLGPGDSGVCRRTVVGAGRARRRHVRTGRARTSAAGPPRLRQRAGRASAADVRTPDRGCRVRPGSPSDSSAGR